ncbi:adenyl cyclase-like protein [Sesbania bispinosa]|nr:adenyl cyclase-like protein [Sesbania bispinosa]
MAETFFIAKLGGDGYLETKVMSQPFCPSSSIANLSPQPFCPSPSIVKLSPSTASPSCFCPSLSIAKLYRNRSALRLQSQSYRLQSQSDTANVRSFALYLVPAMTFNRKDAGEYKLCFK